MQEEWKISHWDEILKGETQSISSVLLTKIDLQNMPVVEAPKSNIGKNMFLTE